MFDELIDSLTGTEENADRRSQGEDCESFDDAKITSIHHLLCADYDYFWKLNHEHTGTYFNLKNCDYFSPKTDAHNSVLTYLNLTDHSSDAVMSRYLRTCSQKLL